MLSSRLATTFAAALLLTATPFAGIPLAAPLAVTAAQAQEASISFSVFFDRLSTNGRWVRHSQYKYVFCPEVDRTWAPYTHGHWVYLADRGWYFDSDEPFAWAVYHYGRWFRDTDLGWCWVPGDTWAPAWVTWRRSNDYVGWAPLPPEGDGFAVGVSFSTGDLPKDQWFFVPSRSFLHPQLAAEIVLGADKPDVFDRTQFAGPVVVKNNVVVNTVINIAFVEQQTQQKVEQVKPQVVNDPGQVHAATQGRTVSVFEAKVQQPKQDEAPKQAIDAAEAAKEIKSQPASGSATGSAQSTNSGTGTAGATNGTANGGTANGTSNSSATGTTSNSPANSTTSNGAATSGNSKADNAAPGAKPGAKCAADQMVNGVCPPAGKGNANAKATDNTTSTGSSSKPGTATTNPTNGTSAGTGANASTGSGSQNPSSGTKNTTGKNAAGTPANGNKVTGNPPAKCAADTMVNGVCPPTGKIGKPTDLNQSSGAAASGRKGNAQTDSGQSAGTSNDNQAAGSGNPKPSRGKGNAACPAGQELVNGVCAETRAKGANGGASQQQ